MSANFQWCTLSYITSSAARLPSTTPLRSCLRRLCSVSHLSVNASTSFILGLISCALWLLLPLPPKKTFALLCMKSMTTSVFALTAPSQHVVRQQIQSSLTMARERIFPAGPALLAEPSRTFTIIIQSACSHPIGESGELPLEPSAMHRTERTPSTGKSGRLNGSLWCGRRITCQERRFISCLLRKSHDDEHQADRGRCCGLFLWQDILPCSQNHFTAGV